MDREEQAYIDKNLVRLVKHLESLRIAEYVQLLERPARLIFLNFIAGVSRGLGIAVGATIVFALVLEFLRRVIWLNIPGIGNFIAEIMRIVELRNGQF